MTAAQFRSSPAWKRAAKRALRDAEYCAICGGWLDRDAPGRSRWAPSVDHVQPLSTIDLATAAGRELAVNQEWLRVTHYGCNASRGAVHGNASRRSTSREWLPLREASERPQRPSVERLFDHPPVSSREGVPRVWSLTEAVDRLRDAGRRVVDDDPEYAGVDEPLRV